MKKTLALLLLTALLLTPLSGCNKSSENKTDGIATTTDNIPAYNAADANPSSDFEYTVGEDGGITITKYIGTDTDVVIPERIDGKHVTVIGEGAFYRCEILKSVLMSNQIVSIENSSFSKCIQLTIVRLSDALVTIGEAAFNCCEALSTISLPDSLTCIDTLAFANCKSLKQINIPAHSFDNVPVDEYHAAFLGSGLESIKLAEGIKFIPNATFAESMLREIILPNSIQLIDQSAFADCENLEKIELNEGLSTIDFEAFKNTKLKEIVLPRSVEVFRSSAVEGATSLIRIYFEGDAPRWFSANKEGATFTIYYHEGAEGFTSPEWNGYKTEIW